MRRFVVPVLLLVATPLAAQEGVPWRASYFPYLIGNPSTGLMLVGHYHYGRAAEYEAKVPFDGIFSSEAGWSTNNSRFVSVKFRAPLLLPGWRFAADAGAGREGTFGYYGNGPDGANESLQPDQVFGDEFFRVRRTRYFVRGEVTRRVAGPLSVSVAGGFAHYRFSSSKDGSIFDTDYLTRPLSGNDLTGRLSLVLDTRDDEYLPGNGVLFEAGLYGGSGRFEERFIPPLGTDDGAASFSDGGYAGGYLHLRGYVSPRSGTVVAARLAARALDRGAPLDARYIVPGWERDITVMGGADSHRSFVPGRFVGRGVLLGSLEVRHNLLDLGDLGAVTLIGFVDGGRVFGDRGIRWTLDRWQVGGGGGVAVRILRSAPLVMNFAGGPDGFVFTMGNGWSF
ncbi:MAG TPA: hypothetical protein VFU23_11085 [Gemmatimonadales bacterium]|nr:hypothetical protein [Gemmatimonadales bacterium]